MTQTRSWLEVGDRIKVPTSPSRKDFAPATYGEVTALAHGADGKLTAVYFRRDGDGVTVQVSAKMAVRVIEMGENE